MVHILGTSGSSLPSSSSRVQQETDRNRIAPLGIRGRAFAARIRGANSQSESAQRCVEGVGACRYLQSIGSNPWALRHANLRAPQHLRREVYANDTRACPERIACEVARPACEIQYSMSGSDIGAAYSAPSPPRIDSSGHHPVQKVVAGCDVVEHVFDVAALFALAGKCHRHGSRHRERAVARKACLS